MKNPKLFETTTTSYGPGVTIRTTTTEVTLKVLFALADMIGRPTATPFDHFSKAKEMLRELYPEESD